MYFKTFLLIFTISTPLKSSSAQYGYSSFNDLASTSTVIGLLTDRQHEEMNTVVDTAIENANLRLETPLAVIRDQVPYGNSYLGYGKICRMMEVGISAVLGPSSKYTVHHLMSICEVKDIPYFYSFMGDVSTVGFNLYPHYEDFSKALYSLLVAFDWSRFIFLYESVEYLNIFNSLMRQYGLNGPIVTVLRYNINQNGNYKTVLRRVRKSVDNRILVTGSTETMAEFLKQAQQVGIINEDYKYIIANLDFHSLELEEYKYSEANITSLRMFSPEKPQVKELIEKLGYTLGNEGFQNGSCPITMEMALTYDAVQIFAETTKQIPLKSLPLNCTDRSNSIQDDGSTFKNYMRSININENTITGGIYFEGYVRKGFTFDVIELQPSGIVQVGVWDEVHNYTSHRLAPTSNIFENVDNSLANKTFIILLSVPNKPYASFVESHKKLEGNNQFEGYSVDLIKELSIKLGFNYTFVDGGNEYGTFIKATNTSSGMLKEIIEGRADLAVTDLTITSERQEVLDFTIPFMNLGMYANASYFSPCFIDLQFQS